MTSCVTAVNAAGICRPRRSNPQMGETDGAVTVLMTFVTVLILSLILVSLESARQQGAVAILRMNVQTAAESVLGEYYAPLFDDYGLYGLYDVDVAEEIQSYLETSGRPEKEIAGSHPRESKSCYSYAYDVSEVALSRTVSLLHGGAVICRNQMIEEGKITADKAVMGYVGAFTYAEVISGFTSFYLGAKSVCPTVTMKVQFTGSWYDETGEKEAANALINAGCVLISQHADSMGAPTACETAGVPNISYNGSTVSACPKTFIVSSRINWSKYYAYVYNCVKEGKEIATDWTGGFKEGSVELSAINEQAAAPGTKEKVEAVIADLKAGKIKVFDTNTFTVDKGKKLESYKADIDTDKDFTPDTEVVSDGYFHESEKRSAPAFDINIDGIEYLNVNYGD